MAKAGRRSELTNVFDDLKKSISDSSVESVSSASGIPSIIDFVENKDWLGLPHRENPINLYPMQRIVLKSFYKNSIGNENLVLSNDEIDMCKKHGLDDDENGNLLSKMESNETFRELILVWGRRCLSEDTKIVDASNNKISTLGNMWDSGQRTITSWTYDEKNNKMLNISDCNLIYQGIRDVYKVETYSGHFVEATLNHPLLTSNGWKTVENLDIENDMIAVSESFPFGSSSDANITEEEARLIGYMIGDGNCSQAATFLTCSNKEILKDFKVCLNTLGDNIKIFKDPWTGAKSKKYQYKITSNYYEYESLGVKDYRNRTLTRRKKNLLMQLLDKYRISRKTCHHKNTPKEILEAPKNIVSNYLKALFSCDGSIYVKKRQKYRDHCQIEFCTVNKEQAYSIQYLLSKFGILANLRTKINNTCIIDENKKKRYYSCKSYVLSFTRKKYINIFLKDIGFIGKNKSVKFCNSVLNNIIEKDSNHDSSFPYSFFKIRHIENVGKKRTFDLQVSDKKHLQNFVCQGIICHNSGKDFVISILACYEAAKLLEAPGGDPYRLYKLGTGAPFTIITIANSSDQAKILFDEIKDKIINSPYFKDKFYPEAILADQIRLLTPADKNKNEELEAKGLPKSLGSVIIKCGHSNSDSLAGISCYTLLFDEIGLYKQTAGSSGGESLYRTLTPATTTYIREVESVDGNGNKVVKTVYDGKVICISSPRGKDGVFYELFRTTPQVKDRLACKLPTWAVNPKQKRDQLRSMFSQMTEEEFNMEFGADFSGVSGQTFFSRDVVEKCFYLNMKAKDYGEPGFRYFCHLDPATSSHNYALSVVHKENFINETNGKVDWRIVVDHVHYWTPSQDKPIVTEEIDSYIISLNRKFFLSLVTFDQWNSASSIKNLQKHGIPSKLTRFTKRYKIILYDNFYDLACSGRLAIPHHELLKNEMLFLQRKYMPNGYRVYAKKDGFVRTDDLCDSLAGACYTAVYHEAEKFPSGRLAKMAIIPGQNEVIWRGMQGQVMGLGNGSSIVNNIEKRTPFKF